MNEVIFDSSDMKDIGSKGMDLSELIKSDELIGHVKNINSRIGEDQDLHNSYLEFRDEIDRAQIAVIDTESIISGDQFDSVNFSNDDSGFIELKDEDFWNLEANNENKECYLNPTTNIDDQFYDDDGISFMKEEYIENEIEFVEN